MQLLINKSNDKKLIGDKLRYLRYLWFQLLKCDYLLVSLFFYSVIVNWTSLDCCLFVCSVDDCQSGQNKTFRLHYGGTLWDCNWHFSTNQQRGGKCTAACWTLHMLRACKNHIHLKKEQKGSHMHNWNCLIFLCVRCEKRSWLLVRDRGGRGLAPLWKDPVISVQEEMWGELQGGNEATEEVELISFFFSFFLHRRLL